MFSAPFAAVYVSSPGVPRIDAADEMFTIAPPPDVAIAGIVYLHDQTTALSATSMIESHASFSSSVTRRSRRPGPMSSVGAALFTSVVSLP